MMDNSKETDPLETLIKYAGHRESVDPAVTDRVEAQLYSHWQGLVKDRQTAARRKRVGSIGGGLALAASVVLAVIVLWPETGPAPIVARVASNFGAVQSGERGEPLYPLKFGHTVHAGSILETGVDSGLGLQLASGHDLRVAASSRLRIEAGKVLLDRGRIYIDSGADGRSEAISVFSRYATVTEIGTQYQVELLDDGIEVAVREGQVRLAASNSNATARAGEAVILDDDGVVSREEILRYGERWQWIAPLSSTIAIDGKSIAEFLDWMARETGWQVSYANDALRRSARGTLLNGSIEGLPIEDALETVMITTGWDYQLVDGEVLIGATAAEAGE